MLWLTIIEFSIHGSFETTNVLKISQQFKESRATYPANVHVLTLPFSFGCWKTAPKSALVNYNKSANCCIGRWFYYLSEVLAGKDVLERLLYPLGIRFGKCRVPSVHQVKLD